MSHKGSMLWFRWHLYGHFDNLAHRVAQLDSDYWSDIRILERAVFIPGMLERLDAGEILGTIPTSAILEMLVDDFPPD